MSRVVAPAILESLARHGLVRRSLASGEPACRIVQSRLYLEEHALREPLLRLLDGSGFGAAPLLRLRLLSRLLRLESLERECCAVLQRLTQELKRQPLADWDTPELLALLRLTPRAGFRDELVGAPPAGVLAQLCAASAHARLRALLARSGQGAETAASLTSGLHGMVDVECASALWDLADEARRVPKLERLLAEPPPRMPRLERLAKAGTFRAGLQALLNRFGHRGRGETELARPRWAEDPEPLLSVIAGYLALAPEASPNVAEWRQHWDREAALQRVRRALRFRPLRRLAFEWTLRVAQRTGLAAANVQFEAAGLYAALRGAALELGARLARAGAIEQRDDVFFLMLEELEGTQQAALRERVRERRAQYARDAESEPAPRVDAEGSALELPVLPQDAGPLRGVPGVPGCARGPVSILRESRAAAPAPGDVLVATHADPAWTPFFAVASAVVLETGSASSPAIMIARELGVPCVADVAAATKRLRDGESVEVDGSRGTVARLDAANAESGEAA